MAFHEKFLRTPSVIEMNGRHIKRYHVNNVDSDVDAAIQQAAYSFLPFLLADTDDETPPASFVVLHRGQGNAAYLNAYSWVWGNVIECRTSAAGIPFLGCDDEDSTNFKVLAKPWIGCVWELPPMAHERTAWVRHILAPDEPDLAGYLADRMAEGMVGGV
jgi:hypothetical protein